MMMAHYVGAKRLDVFVIDVIYCQTGALVRYHDKL